MDFYLTQSHGEPYVPATSNLLSPRPIDLLSSSTYGKLGRSWRSAIESTTTTKPQQRGEDEVATPVATHDSGPKGPREGEQGSKRLAPPRGEEEGDEGSFVSDDDDMFDDEDEIDEWGAGTKFWKEREEARLKQKVSDESDDDDDSSVEGWAPQESQLQEEEEVRKGNIGRGSCNQLARRG